MGEIADMMLEGILDEQTGEYIGKAVGYPRTKEKGFYNTIGRRRKGDKIQCFKVENLGGAHLIGKNIETEKHGKCEIIGLTGKRGRKRYEIKDQSGETYKVKFSKLIFK